ncbi:MAG TPA: hypothetical protein ENJ97_07600, partial [Planctomycetes bacterium]|nr:hypothetical protein [Planctomycetota bacterium]
MWTLFPELLGNLEEQGGGKGPLCFIPGHMEPLHSVLPDFSFPQGSQGKTGGIPLFRATRPSRGAAMKPWSFFLFSFLLLSASFPAPGRAQETLSLAGKWRFRLLAPGEKPLVGPKAEDSAWPSIRVPGHWELQGFGKACYETPNDETGLYRRRVPLPAAWKGKRVFLRAFGIFEGVDIFVNGKKAARHEGGYTPFRIEITSLVRPGEKNLLALVVQKKIPHYRIDNGDFWQLGGIYKKIDLLALPGEAAILRC